MRIGSANLIMALSIMAISGKYAVASELLVDQDKNTDMIVSIYNNNLGLIQDTRKVMLQKGNNEVAFAGVASSIQAESAFLSGKGINVLEQNYDYNLLTGQNMLNSFVGKEVKTAVQNPSNGETIFDKATLLSSNYGSPVLKFAYGVETAFPGRIIYDTVPENLRVKPTLVADLESQQTGEKDLKLTYLTNGLSWKADYVAEIISENELELNTWITIRNETGTDYEKADVRLISGSVNHISDGGVIRPMMMAKAIRAENAMVDTVSATGSLPESVSDYYMYNLPRKTTLKDKQSKQISLMNLQKVQYEKEYRFNSPLYLGLGGTKSEFEKKHPNIVFKLINEKQYNLGQPLPAGMMRFYENHNNKNMVFLGENKISQTAVGEKAELSIGQAFDIYADGKIKDIKVISKDIYEYQVEINFKNVSPRPGKIVYEQNLYNNWELLKENIPSENKNSSTLRWQFDLQPQANKVLTYTVRVSRTK